MSTKAELKSARLQDLIQRRDRVLAILHPPTAAHTRIMEKAGCEALFVGTGGVVGAYTGLADVGTATMTECVTIAGWIAESVSIPVIMDGDTGHGGIMAVRRMVRECIHAGVAGIRIDDQPIESKRKTQSAGVAVVPLDQAIARYRAAVDMKNELDPNFVVMAQCYARDASDGTLEDTTARLRAYREEAGVDWVQFESPHSVDEIRAARASVTGPFSFMKGKLGRYLDLDEHLALGVTIAWYPAFTHQVTWAALWDFMTAFQAGGVKVWDAFVESRRDRPYPMPEVPEDGESGAKQQALEQRPFEGVSDGTGRLQDLRLRHTCRPGCAHSSCLSQRGRKGQAARLGDTSRTIAPGMRPTPRASAAIGLWNPTGHWLDAFPASSYLRLEPSIWQDYPGSLS